MFEIIDSESCKSEIIRVMLAQSYSVQRSQLTMASIPTTQ